MSNEMPEWYGRAKENSRDFVAAAREAVATAYERRYLAHRERIPRLPRNYVSTVDGTIAFLERYKVNVTGFSVDGVDIRIMINDNSLANPGLEFLIRKAENGSYEPPELILKMRDLFYE